MNTLKNLPVWVNWIIDPEDGKVPKNPKTGGNAKTSIPSTWNTLELAKSKVGTIVKHKKYERDEKGDKIKDENGEDKYYTVDRTIEDVGFCFTDGVCGIDIDKCRGNPELEARADEIIQFMNTYTEYSPSGNGYHIIFKCDISKLPWEEKEYKDTYYQNAHNGLECYIAGLTNKYFTYTGEAVNSLDIEDRTDELLTFLEKYMRKSPQQNANSAGDSTKNNAHTSTSDVLSIARRAKNSKKFVALFDEGNISAYNNDDSSADLALCNMLAFYCQGDAEMIDELFRQSKLYRQKWERADYRNSTISKAIALCNGEFYRPKGKSRKSHTTTADAVTFINPLSDKNRYRLDDIGIGYLFADTYKNVSRFVPEAKSWYYYDGKVWKQDVEGLNVTEQGKDLCKFLLKCAFDIKDSEQKMSFLKFYMKAAGNKGRKIMIEEARSVYPVRITEFDADPYIFNCQNCTLDLKDFTMHAHKPEDFLSKISNVNFDKDAKCERWESFVKEVMQDDIETAKYLQKSLGYALTGDTSEECFFILYGATTRNGKGTSMETIIHLLGDYGKTAQPESIAQKQTSNSGSPTEDIARLKGARFVNMSEPDKGLRLNSALVKQLTGGDTVTARFLHQNSFEYRPEYKLFINTNHLPKVGDDSVFSSGRVKLIPFERHFEENEQDKGLKVFFKNPENISGIFNWCVEGLKLMRDEGLQSPPKVIEATKQYREDSDTVGLFVKECLVKDVSRRTLLKAVYADYFKWCTEYGYSPLGSRNLSSELRRRGMNIDRAQANKFFLFGYYLEDAE